LIFPHHENEIAQSEAASGKKPFAKYWMHNGFVTIKKEKMAKSTGNILPLKELLGKYDGETIRLFLLQTHYRQPLDYSEENVAQAKDALLNLKNAINRLEVLTGKKDDVTFEIKSPALGKIRGNFIKAMENDLNTPFAIAELYRLRDYAFESMEEYEKYKGKEVMHELEQTLSLFLELGGVLGIFISKWKKIQNIPDKEIRNFIAKRDEAKKKKDWKTADKIRDGLKKEGIVIEDNKDGSVSWHAE
jgi:cysteinyl-tRNA synthetase